MDSDQSNLGTAIRAVFLDIARKKSFSSLFTIEAKEEERRKDK